MRFHLITTMVLFSLVAGCASSGPKYKYEGMTDEMILKRLKIPLYFTVPEFGRVKRTWVPTALDYDLGDVYDPDDPIENAREVRKHAEAGVAAYAAGNLDEAIICFRRALKVEPGWNRVRFDLAFTLYVRANDYSVMSHKEWQRAKGMEFDEIEKRWYKVEMSREERERHYALADAYYRAMARLLRRAIDEWRVVGMQRPDEPRVAYYMAWAYLLLDELDNARRCWEFIMNHPAIREDIKERVKKALKILDRYEKAERAEGPARLGGETGELPWGRTLPSQQK